MAEHITIIEMGPRDGLQNEPRAIPTADKIRLVDLLSQTGLSRIEVTSFVSPKWVPQMADATVVLTRIIRAPGVKYTALTPNLRGFETAMAAGVDEVAVFASASEGFSRANINCTIAESLDRFSPILAAAGTAGVKVRGYVSCVTDCPYDGPTPPQQVAHVARVMMDLGCYAVSLGDTIGHATSETTARMLDAVLPLVPAPQLAGHFHDTEGLALANIAVSLGYGLRCFDTAVAGLGGCPFAPRAKGNVSTEAVVGYLHEQGFVTGIDELLLAAAAQFAQGLRNV
jgi:hydroxymethylglutaryl-CoA lyase